MGTSTDGQICFGVIFEDGTEFPWHSKGLEDWWIEVSGFKPTAPIYDDDGGYINGLRPPETVIDVYYQERREFKKAHPVPFEDVNYCSSEYPMYILAVKRTFLSNNRGYPLTFKPEDLTVTEEEKAALLEFCKKYDLAFQGEPGWILSSYWG